MHQCFATVDLYLVELLLECAEQAFDPAVHPRAARYAELLPDACELAAPAEDLAAEHACIVGTYRSWDTIASDGEEQVAEECPCVLALEYLQGEQFAAAVIFYAEDGVVLPGKVAFACHVDGPGVVEGNGAGRFAPYVPAHDCDLVAVAADGVADERFAYSGVVTRGVKPVEEFFDGAAAFAGESSKAQNFFGYPEGFGASAADEGFVRRDAPRGGDGRAFSVEGSIRIQGKYFAAAYPDEYLPMQYAGDQAEQEMKKIHAKLALVG